MSEEKRMSRTLCRVTGIVKRYPAPAGGAPIAVLDGVTFSLNAAESLAVTGPSGSGKTTLLNIVSTLDFADSGSVVIDGNDISRLSQRDLARMRNGKIGIVFQKHHLLPHCTLLENVLLPTIPWPQKRSRAQLMERAQSLLDRVGLSARARHLPGQLSGGECQRAAVVRALINSPRLLCADEPTGSLDRGASEALGELLTGLNKEENTALLIVTHSSALAARMDKCVELRDGKCVEAV
jgi:ABC-type lipoprotein export system ATPase subunit